MLGFKRLSRDVCPGSFSFDIERALFLFVVLICVLENLYLYFSRRIIVGHDTWHYELLQYYFLNSIHSYHVLPQWIPYVSFGSTANLYYVVCGSMWLNMLSLFPSLILTKSFVPIFYIGILLDELVLIVGVWLLSRRFFVTVYARFFVVLAVYGTAIWYMQIFWNFKLFYAIPLILYLLHQFIDTTQLRFVMFAAIVFILQCFGSLAYFLPLHSFVVVLYFCVYFVFNLGKLRNIIASLAKRKLSLALCLIYVVLLFAVAGRILSLDVKDYFMPLRPEKGSVDLQMFLSYGNWLRTANFIELVLGKGLTTDYQLYPGILTLALFPLGIACCWKRPTIHLGVVLFSLVLFSAGIIVPRLLFYAWPLMHYYRHLNLSLHFTKIFVVLMAGLGLDFLLLGRRMPWFFLLIPVLVLLLVLSVQLFFLLKPQELGILYKYLLTIPTVTNYPEVRCFYDLDVIKFDMLKSFVVTCLALVSLVMIMFGRKRLVVLGIVAILTLHIADLLAYRGQELFTRTLSVSQNILNSFNFSHPKPPKSRKIVSASSSVDEKFNLLHSMPFLRTAGYTHITNAFLLSDNIVPAFRDIYWPVPLNDFLQAMNWTSPYGFKIYSPMFSFVKHVYSIDTSMTAIYQDPMFLTDQQTRHILSHSENMPATLLLNKKAIPCTYKDKLKAIVSGRRLAVPSKIIYFSDNSVEITTGSVPGNCWLYYSNGWNAHWSAMVNNSPVGIKKAFLAFMAVPLNEGENVVKLSFSFPFAKECYLFIGINAWIWFGMLWYLFWQCFVRRQPLPSISTNALQN